MALTFVRNRWSVASHSAADRGRSRFLQLGQLHLDDPLLEIHRGPQVDQGFGRAVNDQ